MMIDISGVWHYRESFPEGFSTGYLIISKNENEDYIANLHGAEHSLGDKPFYFVEGFDISTDNKKLVFNGISVYGLFEEQEYFLDTWIIDSFDNKHIIATSVDEQGASGAVVLTKI